MNSFSMEVVTSKITLSTFVVVVVYDDARKFPNVEKIMEKYGKFRHRNYTPIENRYGSPIDRVAVYILESVASDRLIKSALKNVEASGDVEIIIRKC